MAEFLVMNKSNPLTRGFQFAEPVIVKPDGHQWGRLENPLTDPEFRFRIIKVPGMTVEQAELYIQEAEEVTEERTGGGMERRLWRFKRLQLRRMDPISILTKDELEDLVELKHGG